MMEFEFSAGGVVLRDDQVLLIRSVDLKGRSVWSFPKGKLNAGEKSPEAALREVQEETGWRCRIDAELPRSEYWFQREGHRVKKTVRWYRMTPIEQLGSHDDEIQETLWIPVPEAMTRLTYQSDRNLLETAVNGLGPPQTESRL
jgi:diadenosine hexaphosphate hydrolase (ATP-forming)